MTTPILSIEDLHYTYPGGKSVLKGASFTLPPGKKVGLVGPNGSGKTTLLNLVMGLLKPDSGMVLVNGEPVITPKDIAHLRRVIGLVFQNADDQLFSPTVIEDVAFGPLNLGRSPKTAMAMAQKTLEQLNICHLEQSLCHKLSGGEKKMVSIASVLAMDPQALLLDEPSAGLDPDAADQIVEVLNGLPQSTVIVSHDYEFLARTTREIYGMHQGRILYDGKAQDLHTHRHAHPMGKVPHSHGEN